jgi:hypothetical protein
MAGFVPESIHGGALFAVAAKFSRPPRGLLHAGGGATGAARRPPPDARRAGPVRIGV